jgi:D-3-phosphoglycerate dehydrogenase
MTRAFRIAVSHDLAELYDQRVDAGIGLDALDSAGLTWEFLAEVTLSLRADQLRSYDALILLEPQLTAASLLDVDRLALVARFGVGYDNVDVDACSANGTIVTITPQGVRRPMAVSALTFVLALSQHVLLKDRLTRSGRWSDRDRYIGLGLEGRTIGVIGLGNIGRELCRLALPFELRTLGCDPHATPAEAAALGVELVDLDTLLQESDFVVVMCPLTSETFHLIDRARLELMKPSAFLINVARGAIVDQQALTAALRLGGIAGAGLDVFEREPIDADDPLLSLDNVIVTPHAIGSTDQCLLGCGRGAVDSVLAVARGEPPQHVVDARVLDQPLVRERLRSFAAERASRDESSVES